MLCAAPPLFWYRGSPILCVPLERWLSNRRGQFRAYTLKHALYSQTCQLLSTHCSYLLISRGCSIFRWESRNLKKFCVTYIVGDTFLTVGSVLCIYTITRVIQCMMFSDYFTTEPMQNLLQLWTYLPITINNNHNYEWLPNTDPIIRLKLVGPEISRH